jgi:hypothetical protein
MTTRDQIKRFLGKHPNQTAWQISQGIGKSAGLVSAVLSKDSKARKVKVARSKGPRGGRAYIGYKA